MLPFSFSSLPLLTSPPILFQYQQTAELVGGKYIFVPARAAFTPDRDLKATATYYFRTVTASADLDPADYSAAIVDTPKFTIYLKQGGSGPLFRDAIRIGKYLDNLPFEYAHDPAVDPNRLQGGIAGTLDQIAPLVGKSSITLTIILSAQEIMDAAFNRALRSGYSNGASSR